MAPKFTRQPSMPLPIEYSTGLYFIRRRYLTSMSRQVFLFFEKQHQHSAQSRNLAHSHLMKFSDFNRLKP